MTRFLRLRLSLSKRHDSCTTPLLCRLTADAHGLEPRGTPSLGERLAVDGPEQPHLVVHADYVRVGHLAVSEEDALLGSGVEGAASRPLRAFRREVCQDQLAEGEQPLGVTSPSDSLEGCLAVVADAPHVQHPGRVLNEPAEERMALRHTHLDAVLEAELVGPQDAGDGLHRCFHVPVAGRVIGIRMLLHDLLQRGDVEPGLRQGVLEELYYGPLVIGPQADLLVAEPLKVLHEHVHGVVLHVDPLLGHYVREHSLA